MTRIKVFYNMMDCPFRGCCIGVEEREREKDFPAHHCSYNPGMFECEFYKEITRNQVRIGESIEITPENIDLL